MSMFWKGKYLYEHDKEELIKIIELLSKQIEELQKDNSRWINSCGDIFSYIEIKNAG